MQKNYETEVRKPEIIVFAGPNGSGKSVITRRARIIEPYINADDIKRVSYCTDMEAAQRATAMREKLVAERTGFSFETVMSTERNLLLLQKAKKLGFFIRCIYVLTADVNINVVRVRSRQAAGGHGVPVDKIRNRYGKALKLVPDLVQICDVMHIYDNTLEPFRIFKRRKDEIFYWENEFWNKHDIEILTGITL